MVKPKLYTCIYCLESRAASRFNREHVLPAAFGRFKDNLVLNHTVCQDCNSQFGRTIDWALARGSMQGAIRYFAGTKRLGEFTNVDQKRVRLGAQIPGSQEFEEAEIVTTDDGDGLAFKTGFTYLSISTGKKRFVSLEILEHGSWDGVGDIDKRELVATTSRDEHMLHRLQDALRRLGLQLDVLAILEEMKPGQRVLVAIDAVMEDALVWRAIAKIAFNYLAYVMGNEFAQGSLFDQIRTYVRYGTQLAKPAVRRIGRLVLYGETEEAKRRAGHVISLELDPNRVNILGSVEFFGAMTYRVELGAFEGLITPIAAGHYYDIVSNRALAMQAIRKPPGLWVPPK